MSRLASEESLALDVEQQLGLEIRKLTVQIQVRRGTSLGVGCDGGGTTKCLGIATECIFSCVDCTKSTFCPLIMENFLKIHKQNIMDLHIPTTEALITIRMKC